MRQPYLCFILWQFGYCVPCISFDHLSPHPLQRHYSSVLSVSPISSPISSLLSLSTMSLLKHLSSGIVPSGWMRCFCISGANPLYLSPPIDGDVNGPCRWVYILPPPHSSSLPQFQDPFLEGVWRRGWSALPHSFSLLSGFLTCLMLPDITCNNMQQLYVCILLYICIIVLVHLPHVFCLLPPTIPNSWSIIPQALFNFFLTRPFVSAVLPTVVWMHTYVVG